MGSVLLGFWFSVVTLGFFFFFLINFFIIYLLYMHFCSSGILVGMVEARWAWWRRGGGDWAVEAW